MEPGDYEYKEVVNLLKIIPISIAIFYTKLRTFILLQSLTSLVMVLN